MSAGHSNTSQQWLIFFFVCFAMSVFAIGVWAAFNYDVHKATLPPGASSSGGGH
ncbi:hypothetical protein KF707_04620 [Candidatus Obscuribacterales bacterium]|jgi:hypothetical protein|nr:hypothetical protein [Candidatus Obscuribacterales bacterium]MBX3135494.1 hypothetical protein [Candidatus Obscuribacterales bacterium]MBX3150461.1 hypothetical protein [Candidatus Obscuribacterales bacterium]